MLSTCSATSGVPYNWISLCPFLEPMLWVQCHVIEMIVMASRTAVSVPNTIQVTVGKLYIFNGCFDKQHQHILSVCVHLRVCVCVGV